MTSRGDIIRRLATPLMVCVTLVSWSNSARAQDLEELFENRPTDWFRSTAESAEADEEELETDRDSFTPATTVVGDRRWLLESSYSFIDNRTTAESHSFPEILTRYGVTDRIEFRFGWNYEAGGGGSVSGSDAPGEEEDVAGVVEEARILYGLKAKVTSQRGWVPNSAVILQATTPTAGPGNATQGTFAYVFGWTLPNDWQLDSAIRYGVSSEEGDHYNQWAPSVVLKIPVHERWKIHGEYFGIMTDGRANEQNAQYFSPGVHYLLTPDCEIGIRVGWGLNHDASHFFSNVGLGLRY